MRVYTSEANETIDIHNVSHRAIDIHGITRTIYSRWFKHEPMVKFRQSTSLIWNTFFFSTRQSPAAIDETAKTFCEIMYNASCVYILWENDINIIYIKNRSQTK